MSIVNPRTERKMGNEILDLISEMYLTPRDNLVRFNVLKKKLDKKIRRFQEYTGRDTLGPQFADVMVKAPTAKVEEIQQHETGTE